MRCEDGIPPSEALHLGADIARRGITALWLVGAGRGTQKEMALSLGKAGRLLRDEF